MTKTMTATFTELRGSLRPVFDQLEPPNRSFRQRLPVLLFCFLTAALTLLICSRSSPLYPFNDWVDVNCFYTVGKGMFNGKVVYRDLYEQKGILLYFLHGLCWLISKGNFFGVYLLETLASTFFLYYTFRILNLYCRLGCILFLPLLQIGICCSESFVLGDSAEELCLPLLSFALFLSLRSFKQQRPLTFAQAVALGITSGAVLWIKFTLLGFYIGWFIVPAILTIAHKDWRSLGRLIGGIAVGILIITLPFVLYFAANHALSDWFEVYFYNNIFLYHGDSATSFLAKILGPINHAVKMLVWNKEYGVFVLLGILYAVVAMKTPERIHLLLCFVFSAFFVFISVSYSYYTLILAVFAPIGILCLLRVIELAVALATILSGDSALRPPSRVTRLLLPLFCALLLIGTPFYCIPNCRNTNLLLAPKEKLPMFAFAEVIRAKENSTLLNYGFLDGGFYTAADRLPNCRFFCTLNMESLTEMDETMNRFIDEGLCDFVVTRELALNSPNYREVMISSYELWKGEEWTFFLYERIDNSESDSADAQN